MSTIVLTGYDDNFAEVGDLTFPLMVGYAAVHGFDYFCVRDYHDKIHPSFQKIENCISWLEVFDNVIWIDADTIVTNMWINPLADCQPGLNVSRDWGKVNPGGIGFNHFSMGNFVATRRAVPVFEYALKQEQWHWVDPGLEQAAIQEGFINHDWIRHLITIHPRRWSNSVDEGLFYIIDPKTGRPIHEDNPPKEPWQPGDWLLHLTGRPNWARIQNLNNYHRTGRP